MRRRSAVRGRFVLLVSVVTLVILPDSPGPGSVSRSSSPGCGRLVGPRSTPSLFLFLLLLTLSLSLYKQHMLFLIFFLRVYGKLVNTTSLWLRRRHRFEIGILPCNDNEFHLNNSALSVPERVEINQIHEIDARTHTHTRARARASAIAMGYCLRVVRKPHQHRPAQAASR